MSWPLKVDPSGEIAIRFTTKIQYRGLGLLRGAYSTPFGGCWTYNSVQIFYVLSDSDPRPWTRACPENLHKAKNRANSPPSHQHSRYSSYEYTVETRFLSGSDLSWKTRYIILKGRNCKRSSSEFGHMTMLFSEASPKFSDYLETFGKQFFTQLKLLWKSLACCLPLFFSLTL